MATDVPISNIDSIPLTAHDREVRHKIRNSICKELAQAHPAFEREALVIVAEKGVVTLKKEIDLR